MKKKRIILLVVLMAMMMALMGCGSQKIDLSEYVDISYSGFNGKAMAEAEMNFVSLEPIFMDSEASDVGNLQRILELENSIKCTIDKTEGISNGDKIVASISWDEEVAKKYKIKFIGEKKEMKVEGLEEGKTIDLFADVKLEYSGISPNAQVTIVNNSKDSYISSVGFVIENGYGMKIANGDEIKVKATCDPAYAEQQGYLVGDIEKTFKAEGIDEYIKEYSIIDKETLDKMNMQSKDLIEAQLAGDKYVYCNYIYQGDHKYSSDLKIETVQISDIKLAHTYFFKIKEGLDANISIFAPVFNSVFQVYQVTAKDSVTPEGVTVYIPAYYKNFILRDNGKIDVIITDGEVNSVRSYENFDNMYRNIVTANKDKYTYEEINH